MNDQLARLFLDMHHLVDAVTLDQEVSISRIVFSPDTQKLTVALRAEFTDYEKNNLLVQTTTTISRPRK